MMVLPYNFPSGTEEMSHDISCTGEDPNQAPAKYSYIEKRYSCSTIPCQKEIFCCHSMRIQFCHTNIDSPNTDFGLAVYIYVRIKIGIHWNTSMFDCGSIWAANYYTANKSTGRETEYVHVRNYNREYRR
jgi:hypothetical protein